MEENTINNGFTIPRLGQGEQLLSEYELSVDGISKGRGSLIIHSKKQTYMLKEVHSSKEKIEALANVLKKLHAWDERNEQILQAKNGAYAVSEEMGPSYILKTYRAGRECDVKNPFEILEGMRKLADLHLELKEIGRAEETFFYAKEHGFLEEMYRHNRELRNLKNYIRKKKRENAFEEEYEKQYAKFYEQASEIYERAKREEAIVTGKNGQLCHGDYHYHNVMDCGQRSYIVHYENLRWDSPAADIAKYMRKALEKNGWNKELGKHMLDTYERVAPLCDSLRRELYLRLAYPEKFWKTANHYNNNKKAWASKRDGEKLLHIVQQEAARREFLEILYK